MLLLNISKLLSYPTKTEDEILEIFRGYARDRKTTAANLANMKANYFYVHDDPTDEFQLIQPLIPDEAIAFHLTDDE